MSKCTNSEFENLLHDYELGLLPEETRRRLELHLYDCDCCLAGVERFRAAANLLRHDKTVHDTINVLSGGAKGPTVKKTSVFYRILVAASLIAVAAVPVYFLGFLDDAPAVIQQLELLPIRSTTNNVVFLDRGGEVEISFAFDDAKTDEFYRIDIVSRDGDTVFTVSNFSKFNDFGRGSLRVSIDTFQKGFYSLSLSNLADDSATVLVQYPFRAE